MSTSTLNVGKNIIGIGRDFRGKIINNNPNELFTAIDVSGFSNDYLPPTIASSLLKNLKAQRLLVVGGDYGFDKDSLLRYLAEQVSTSSQQEVLAWIGTSDQQSLISALGNAKPGIYIMQQLQPHHINYDLQELEKIAQRQQLFVLISTDTPQQGWHQAQIPSYWVKLDDQNIQYDPQFISQELADRLNDNIKQIQFSNGLNKVDKNSQLPGGSLQQLAANFSSPEQVQFFVNQLTDHQGSIDIHVIKDCLKKTLSKQDSLMGKWFHSLDPLEQYTALSMVLFCDLFDDQYFGATKHLSESEWKYSHEGLKALDYKDVEKLFSFFKYDKLGPEQRYLRNKFPNQRIELFKISWNSHRRHIKMALESAVNMVIVAGENYRSDFEVLGSRRKRNALRSSVSRLLSDLGRVSRSMIEEPLVKLASQNNVATQNVAASAIARWREIPGGDQQLFAILSDWQKDSRWLAILDGLLEGRDNAFSSATYLRSAIILAIGKAADYDAPNQLSPQLVELLFSFLDDTHSRIRKSLGNAVPEIIRYHAVQLSRSTLISGKKLVPLEKMLTHEDLINPVALGLAMAFTDRPDEVGKIILSCVQHCKSNASKSRKKSFNDRDKLMAAMVLVVGNIIQLNDINISIGGKAAPNLLEDIRGCEKNKTVQNLILYVVIDQINLNTKNRDLIYVLLKELSANERDRIVERFGEHYFAARKEQDGGDKTIDIGEKSFSTWVHLERPLLDVEILLFDWLEKDNKQLQQLATLSFIQFSALIEHREELYRKAVLEQEEKEAEKLEQEGFMETFKPALFKGRFSLIMFIYKLFVKVTISKGAARIVDAALPVMSRSLLFNRAHKKTVIEKWKKRRGDVQEAAKSLGRVTR